MLEGYQRKLITSSLVLVGGSSKTIGFFFRSAEFFATDHRLVVAILKLHVKSRKISRYDHNVFHLEKLKDLTCAHEYAETVSNNFEVLNALENPPDLWDTFKCETLEATRRCVRAEMSEVTGWVRFGGDAWQYRVKGLAARLAESREQYKALSRRTLLRRGVSGVSQKMLRVI